jgi:carbamoyltransferase
MPFTQQWPEKDAPCGYTGVMVAPKASRDAVLGVACFGHDSSAALVSLTDGDVIFAVAEERITNRKHTWRFPIGSIEACVRHAECHGWRIAEVAINYDETEFINGVLHSELSRILGRDAATQLRPTLIGLLPTGHYYRFTGNFSQWVIDHQLVPLCEDEVARAEAQARIHFYFNTAVRYRDVASRVSALFPGIPVRHVPHHLCHAAAGFLNSGFDRATVLTIDGAGESSSSVVYEASQAGFRKQAETLWPESLGALYLHVTAHLGFGLGDEFKVMGMSAYGRRSYASQFADLLAVAEGGTVAVNRGHPYYSLRDDDYNYGYFGFEFTETLKSLVPPRAAGAPILREHYDLAASVQRVVEDAVVRMASAAIQGTGVSSLVLSGGVALNGLMNERIRRESGCSRLFVYPASADDGTSVGAAQYTSFSAFPGPRRKMVMPYYGSEATDHEVERELTARNIRFVRPSSIHHAIADALAAEKIVARYCGRSEFGPRALGNRSILASARNPRMKDILNDRIKHREPFRPFAPACLVERASEYFDIDVAAPYMLLVPVAKPAGAQAFPAAVHADGTARLQTVDGADNPDFHETLLAYEKLTGLPAVINTSFNTNGEAIVETPDDAIEAFFQMQIDFLAIGPYWVERDRNPEQCAEAIDTATYLEKRRTRFDAHTTNPLKDLDLGDPAFWAQPNSLPPVTNPYVLRHHISRGLAGKPGLKIVCFGAGEDFVRMIEEGLFRNHTIVAVVDNHRESGTFVAGVLVVRPAALAGIAHDLVVITASRFWTDLRDQAERCGVLNEAVVPIV